MDKVITYFEHEEQMVRIERTNVRLWILCILLILMLVGTNIAWIYYESQWQVTTETTEIEAEQDGEINIVGGGDVNYGSESESQ